MTADDPLAGPAVRAAPLLLGALLSRDSGAGRVTVRITEVEAYGGADDPGSHAFRGPTPRTRSMFGPPGLLYVYRSYGVHHCLNVVCGPEGLAAACLIRAGEVVEGAETARERRLAVRGPGSSPADHELARGPGNLARSLGVLPEDDGVPVRAAPFRLRLPDAPLPRFSSGLRVGLAAPGGLEPFRWRVWATGDATVSGYVPHRSVREAGRPG
ncbi:MAG: DNA-3-methyladenine glycosylase [Pseudoclavibacter sp.]|nr:DNA-3-methyladenine glycosylase [Pseudoclavibacter sp.]